MNHCWPEWHRSADILFLEHFMGSQQKLTILIIDDNDVSRTMLRFILSSVPRYEVVGEASTGLRGMALVEQLHPELVCLDVMLPDANGIDLLSQIKQKWPRTAVLMVSGNSDSATVVTAVQGGAAGYLVKPFNPANLLGTVEKAELRLRASPAK
jgi:two-component system chemotaxis response regulator CheY